MRIKKLNKKCMAMNVRNVMVKEELSNLMVWYDWKNYVMIVKVVVKNKFKIVKNVKMKVLWSIWKILMFKYLRV